MLSGHRVQLTEFVPGAPGVFARTPRPPDVLTAVRRDVAAFAGISPRGPALLPAGRPDDDVDVATWLAVTPAARSVAVAVGSWDEYRALFGGFEGPGRLPYAVSSFFAGGGSRAYVVRVVHEAAFGEGRSSGPLGLAATDGTPARLLARSEGSWGDALQVTLRAAARPLPVQQATAAEVVVDRFAAAQAGAALTGGALLRLTCPGDVRLLRFVEMARVVREWAPKLK